MKKQQIKLEHLWPPGTPVLELTDVNNNRPLEAKVCDAQPGVRPLAIKINNFFLWGAAGCFLPYMSVYFLHYTDACEDDFGRLMSISAVAGTMLNISVSSLSDRYRAHRLAYSILLVVTFMSIASLFVPIYKSWHETGAGPESDFLVPTPDSMNNSTELAITGRPDSAITEVEQAMAATTGELGESDMRPVSFYIISLCLALGSLGVTINMNFSESFTANIARICTGDESYGKIRFFGALGWCFASLVLTQVDERAANLPYLFVAWLMFACFTLPNILLVMCWPQKEPFNLSSDLHTTSPVIEDIESASSSIDCRQAESVEAPEFGLKMKNRKSIGGEPIILSIKPRRNSLESIQVAADMRPELRRCSIATLGGGSHLIEQFKLMVPKSTDTDQLKRWPNEQNINGAESSHFKYATRIQRINSMTTIPNDGDPAAGKSATALIICEPEPEAAKVEQSKKKRKKKQKQMIGFRLYLKIIELIARRNKNMIRFMAIYVVVGFTVAMNWYFLFPYIESLDAHKFVKIGPYAMMAGYLSETLFYYVRHLSPIKIKPSIGLSLVLFAFALRYAGYLTFSCYSSQVWPLELVVVVELLQSTTIGWFDCILNESAVEFALEAEHCLPRLIELNLVDDSREAAEMVKNSVKLSLVGVSSCFYDGVGVALGSLAGGWMIICFDYPTLWTVSASLALTVGLLNLLLEWTIFSDGKSRRVVQALNEKPPQPPPANEGCGV